MFMYVIEIEHRALNKHRVIRGGGEQAGGRAGSGSATSRVG
jgi:hypothetical protein